MRLPVALLTVFTVGCTCADPAPAPPAAPARAPITPPTPLDRVDLVSCESGAWVDPSLAEPVVIRGAPVIDGAEMGTLPPGAMLSIIGQRGRWVRIKRARWVKPSASERSWPMGAWIALESLQTGLRPYGDDKRAVLRETPEEDGAVLAEWSVDEAANMVLPWQGCRGPWVRTTFEGQPGWLSDDDHCANTVTACD